MDLPPFTPKIQMVDKRGNKFVRGKYLEAAKMGQTRLTNEVPPIVNCWQPFIDLAVEFVEEKTGT